MKKTKNKISINMDRKTLFSPQAALLFFKLKIYVSVEPIIAKLGMLLIVIKSLLQNLQFYILYDHEMEAIFKLVILRL